MIDQTSSTPQGDTTSQTSSAPQPVTTPQGSVQSQQVGKYTVSVIREKCIGAASCVAIAPGVFELDEEQIAKVISQDGADDESKLLAAQSCPTMAIIVTETATGTQVWPIE